ncbi:4Fe-4S binding protein [[Eubacterium] cellulosolvens]
MNRQGKRNAVIYTSLVLFPITFYYLSPVLIIMSSAEGTINGSFLLFTFLFFSSLFVGRAFCGWACPAAGVQEACFRFRSNRVRGGRYDYIKYLIWVPWLMIIVTMAVQAGGYFRVDPLYQTWHGISVSSIESLVLFLIFLGIIAIPALILGRRAFCHYGCWMAPFMILGRKIRNLFGWSSLHLKADNEKCINCTNCTRDCPMSLDVNSMVQRGDMENSECILCLTCLDGCPKAVIYYSFG